MKYLLLILLICAFNSNAQIGKCFPSERKEITDPVTGTKLIFLASTQSVDSKIYQTHNQWTSDGQWLIFRSEERLVQSIKSETNLHAFLRNAEDNMDL